MATRAKQQVIEYYAYDTAAGTYRTGDSANHSLFWVKDGTKAATTNSPSEVSSTDCPGLYKVTLTNTECDADIGTLHGKSSTTGVIVVPVTIQFERLPDAAPNAAGGVSIVGSAMTLSSAYDAAKGVPGVIPAGYIGNLPANLAVQFKFATVGKSGALVTLAGTPTLSIYGQSSTNERASDAALTVDFDGVTGLHHATLTLTDAFYSNASPSIANYQVVISAGTIDGVSAVGMVVALFSVGTARSGHVSQMATASIVAGTFAGDAISSSAVSATAVTKIQSGLATSTALTAVASIFTGMTSLPKWIRALIRKDAADTQAKTEINNGGGGFDETTDSLEAIRDTAPLGTAMRGTDNALLASGYTAPDNAGISAIKAKTDNLPALPAAAGDIPTGDITAIKGVTDKLDTTLESDGAGGQQFTGAALENGPGGSDTGVTVIVDPILSKVGPGSVSRGQYTLYVEASKNIDIPIVDSTDASVDMTGKSLVFVVRRKNDEAVLFQKTTSSGITINTSTVTVAVDPADVPASAERTVYEGALREDGGSLDGHVWAWLKVDLVYAATKDTA